MEVDYIIVGQGICGTMLSYYLLKAGKKVMVVDKYQSNTASRVASGIINPVTGRRVVKTWMIDELLPFAEEAYSNIGELIGKDIAHQIKIISFHNTEQMSSAWNDRIAEGEEHITTAKNLEYYSRFFNLSYGAGVVLSSMVVDLDTLLSEWRSYLKQNGCLYEGEYNAEELQIADDVLFKDIKAGKIIFCDGVNGYNNPYFKRLPYALTKGEVLTVQIPGLPQDNIYKQGVSLVPIGNEQFWVGSSFEWDFEDDLPSEAFKQKTEIQLERWLKLPFKVLNHTASVRPGCIERRPFVGLHPKYENIGILNGMGTKGCSLAPYFANQLTNHLIDGKSIQQEADILRFKKLLIGS